MKSLNIQNQHKASQSGFTIIELVVVILLLGILAATALPRFIDVTDEAHAAVVSALEGGISTGAALYRAEYVGKGLNGTAPPSYSNVPASTSGYPLLTNANQCASALDNMLQGGHPVVTSASQTVANLNALQSTSLLPASNAYTTVPELAAYFVTALPDSQPGCAFVYTADVASQGAPGAARYVSLTHLGETTSGLLP